MWYIILIAIAVAVIIVLGIIFGGSSDSGRSAADDEEWENQPRTTGNGW